MGNVKLFRSTDFGAPSLTGQVSSLINVFDACLVNGYGQQNISTMTHSGGVVTVTTASSHNLTSHSRQTIAGANESGYNGEFMITVTSPNTFTYQAAGITVSPATGTLTTKSASAGWTKPYTGTNLAAFRPGAGPRHYLRIDDTTTTQARAYCYEDMTAISSGTNQFPTTVQLSGGFYVRKSVSADAVARTWILIADDSTMYFYSDTGATISYSQISMFGFGKYTTYKIGEVYNTFISGCVGNGYTTEYFSYLATWTGTVLNSSDTGMYSCRSHTGVAQSVVCAKIGDYAKSGQTYSGYANGMPYPSPIDGGLWLKLIEVVEGGASANLSLVRGSMPGLYQPLHAVPFSPFDIFDGNGALAGKKFLVVPTVAAFNYDRGQMILDISMTW